MSLGRVVAGLVVIAVALAAVGLTASRQES